MEENIFNITEEDLKKMSPEEIAELKVDLEDASYKIRELLEDCDEILNMK